MIARREPVATCSVIVTICSVIVATCIVIVAICRFIVTTVAIFSIIVSICRFIVITVATCSVMVMIVLIVDILLFFCSLFLISMGINITLFCSVVFVLHSQYVYTFQNNLNPNLHCHNHCRSLNVARLAGIPPAILATAEKRALSMEVCDFDV